MLIKASVRHPIWLGDCLIYHNNYVCIGAKEVSGAGFVDFQNNDIYDPQRIALGLLAHPSPTIRITAFSIVTSSASPFSVQKLDVLQQFVPFFHAEVNPKFRNEFITLMVKYCDRMGHNFSALCKSSVPHKSMPTLNPVHSEYVAQDAEDEMSITRARLQRQASFSKWYTTFLIDELQPTASYQRHITALKILDAMFQVGLYESIPQKPSDPASILDNGSIFIGEQFFGSRCIRLLQDLIMDPFDDVRLAVSSILKKIFCNTRPCDLDYLSITDPNRHPIISYLDAPPQKTYLTYILFVLRQAEDTMSLTGRADHADGVGRLYSLLYDSCRNLGGSAAWSENGWSILDYILSALEKDIIIARRDIRLATRDAPLHGKLVALR